MARRLLVLAASVLAGSAVAAVGHWLWPGPYWALAVPLAMALGWWCVADPTQCAPPRDSPTADE